MPEQRDLVLMRLQREVAARKEAERLLETKSDELESYRQELLERTTEVRRLSAAIDMAEEGIAIAEPDGTFVYMNRAHARMFGRSSPAALVGQVWSSLYDSETLARFEREILPQFDSNGRWAGEVVGRSEDGTPVFQDLVLTRLEDGGILCATRDIAQRRIREKETADLRRRVIDAERRAAVDHMVNIVIHDFSNFLGAIDASVTLLERQCDQPEPHKLIMSVVEALYQARMVMGQLSPEYEAPEAQICDLADMMPRLCDLMAPLMDVSHTFYREVPDTPLFVLADPTLFARAVANLLKNAMESMTDGGRVLRLHVEALPAYVGPVLPFRPASHLAYGRVGQRALARIIIHDQGVGMPQKVADRALDEFVTTKGAGRRRGIGLSSVKGLVDSVGGRLEIHSLPAVGTVMVLDLPAADLDSTRRATAIAEEVIGNVVLVDDDPMMLAALGTLFAADRWEVASFVDPLEALAFMERAPLFAQLLVTDRRMPGMSGDELAIRVKQIRCDLPVVMCSNALGAAVPDAVDATLAKPPNAERLQAVLTRLRFVTEGDAT
ncbi:MAG: response regulator [bacterium]|nr:response regulator [bacterium]